MKNVIIMVEGSVEVSTANVNLALSRSQEDGQAVSPARAPLLGTQGRLRVSAPWTWTALTQGRPQVRRDTHSYS